MKDEALLFVHGWATDNWVWETSAKEIAEGRPVYNLNLPGHGGLLKWEETAITPAVREISRSTSAVKEGIIGIGWSLGAQALIASSLENKRLKAVVLIGATPCFVAREDFPWGQPKALVRRMIQDMKKDPGGALDRFYGLNFPESDRTGWVKKFVDRYRYPGPISCDTDIPGCFPAFKYDEITNALQALYNTDLRSALGSLDVPALVIHGRLDAVCPVGAGEYLAKHIRGAELRIFERSGHAPFLTEADRFNRAVKEFIKKL